MIIKNNKTGNPFEIKIIEGKKIVHETLIGIWTPDIAQEYNDNFKSIAKKLISDRWTKLSIMDGFTLSVDDEVLDIFKDSLDWARDNNLKYCAHVIADKAKRMLHQEELLLIGTYGFTELFKNETEAMQWLALKGF